MALLGILFELYLASFAHFAGYQPNLFLQQKASQCSYVSPLQGQLELIGNCGELRANHFHTGWDLSTQGKEGANVIAIEDGFVSRIRVSSSGYGKAIYITHANGLTSVYAHLSRFEPELEDAVLVEMKRFKQNEFDWYWPKGKFEISKGAVIGRSGNTGSSTGPHLHFELRDAFTELVYNPSMLFEGVIKDEIAPSLSQVALSAIDKNGARTQLQCVSVKEQEAQLITAQKNVFISVSGQDRSGSGKHHLGIYSLKLFDEKDRLLYSFKQDKLDFSKGRFANAVNDYLCDSKGGNSWYTLFQSLNNRWPQLKRQDCGIDLSNGDRSLRVEIADEKGIQQSYSIVLHYDVKAKDNTIAKATGICLSAGSVLHFSPQQNIEVYIGAEMLYESVFWPTSSYKGKFPPPMHKSATAKMVVKGVKLDRKQGTYAVVKQKSKEVEKCKVLWKGDTAVFEFKQIGEFELKHEEKQPLATIKKGNIQLLNTSFLTQYNVYDNESGDWLPVELNPKNGQLKFVEKQIRLKQIKVVCKDLFGRESLQLLEFNR